MKDVSNCNCFAGEPYIDAAGNCRCTDAGYSGPPPPLQPHTGYPQARGGMVYTMRTNGNATAPTAAADNTIFGLNPLVALGIAAVGVWALSSMSAGGKKSFGGNA